MADILPYLGVEKTEETAQKVPVPDCTGLTVADAARKLKESELKSKFVGDGGSVTDQIPAPDQQIPAGSEVLLYLEEVPEQRRAIVPDFAGMHRQQAAQAAGELGLYLQITGNAEISPKVTAISQNIPKGTQVPVGTTITLKFTDTTVRD